MGFEIFQQPENQRFTDSRRTARNRTNVELKPFDALASGQQHGSQSHQCGIETYNLCHRLRLAGTRNRTNVELKPVILAGGEPETHARNRTNVELKHYQKDKSCERDPTRNRTNVELKPMQPAAPFIALALAIAPMWN